MDVIAFDDHIGNSGLVSWLCSRAPQSHQALKVVAVRSEHSISQLEPGLTHRKIGAHVTQFSVEDADNLLPGFLAHVWGWSVFGEGEAQKKNDEKRETADKHDAPRTNTHIIDPVVAKKGAPMGWGAEPIRKWLALPYTVRMRDFSPEPPIEAQAPRIERHPHTSTG